MGNNDLLRNMVNGQFNNNNQKSEMPFVNPFNNNTEDNNISEVKVTEEVRKGVTDHFGQDLINKKEDKQFQASVRQFIKEMLDIYPAYRSNPLKKEPLVEKIYNDIVGFGPLQILLQDPDITEIMVTSYDKVYIEKKGVMTLVSDIKFNSEDHLQNTIQKIVQPMGRKIDDAEPLCDTSLPDGSRVNATFPPATPDGATLTIRKFSEHKLVPADYLNFKSLNEDMVKFLRFAVAGKANIIVAGGTGTGKTTLLNMISQFISPKDAIVTIEDTLELQLQQSNVRRMLARKPVNGKGELTIRSLVKNTLRMRPDRICVGEIRGGEIYDMLDSMSSGHEGGMGTIHSKSPRHLVDIRIPVLMAMSDIKMEASAQKKMISDAIDLIVYIKRFRDGSRKITNITEVVGFGEEGAAKMGIKKAEEKIYLKDIFTFREDGYDKQGKVYGEYVTTGYVPRRILDKAAIYDAYIDESIFTKNGEIKKASPKSETENIQKESHSNQLKNTNKHINIQKDKPIDNQPNNYQKKQTNNQVKQTEEIKNPFLT